MSILKITDKPYDDFCDRLGLNPVILYYNRTPIIPNPVVAYRGSQNTVDVPSEFNPGEMLPTWQSSIPQQTLRDCLGVRWEEFIQPAWSDQKWTVRMPGKQPVRVRVLKEPAIDPLSSRYQLVFVGMGEDDV